jgi:hypothetical protein
LNNRSKDILTWNIALITDNFGDSGHFEFNDNGLGVYASKCGVRHVRHLQFNLVSPFEFSGCGALDRYAICKDVIGRNCDCLAKVIVQHGAEVGLELKALEPGKFFGQRGPNRTGRVWIGQIGHGQASIVLLDPDCKGLVNNCQSMGIGNDLCLNSEPRKGGEAVFLAADELRRLVLRLNCGKDRWCGLLTLLLGGAFQTYHGRRGQYLTFGGGDQIACEEVRGYSRLASRKCRQSNKGRKSNHGSAFIGVGLIHLMRAALQCHPIGGCSRKVAKNGPHSAFKWALAA